MNFLYNIYDKDTTALIKSGFGTPSPLTPCESLDASKIMNKPQTWDIIESYQRKDTEPQVKRDPVTGTTSITYLYDAKVRVRYHES